MTDEELDAPSYLIVKRGYYYRPNEHGYTSSAIQAGRYTLTEAEKITHPNGVDGPRDGMTFIHEDEVNDEDWKAYTTLRAQLAEARANARKLIAATTNPSGQKCEACRATGAYHCGDPFDCGGMVDIAIDEALTSVMTLKARADRAEQRVATLEHEVRLREAALSIANATLAAQIEADAWQPIETAPKDGTDFIAWWPFNYSGKVVPCHWVEGKGNRKGYFKYMSIKIEPTHWKSFPSNPDQPHDRTALDRHDAKTREKALLEAAALFETPNGRSYIGEVTRKAILALIEAKP